MTQTLFISGISTDVGKTVAAAIIAEALQAHYWKPVQAGDLDNSDSIKVSEWTRNVNVLPEAFRLTSPMSPHAAARIDGCTITIPELPEVSENLVIEGAGGLLVPLNDDGLLVIDLIEKWKLPTVLVSRHYLGSINHTLMSIEVLKQRGLPIAGIVFVGEANAETERIIARSGVAIIGRIPWLEELTPQTISEEANRLKPDLLEALRNVKHNETQNV